MYVTRNGKINETDGEPRSLSLLRRVVQRVDGYEGGSHGYLSPEKLHVYADMFPDTGKKERRDKGDIRETEYAS